MTDHNDALDAVEAVGSTGPAGCGIASCLENENDTELEAWYDVMDT